MSTNTFFLTLIRPISTSLGLKGRTKKLLFWRTEFKDSDECQFCNSERGGGEGISCAKYEISSPICTENGNVIGKWWFIIVQDGLEDGAAVAGRRRRRCRARRFSADGTQNSVEGQRRNVLHFHWKRQRTSVYPRPHLMAHQPEGSRLCPTSNQRWFRPIISPVIYRC